jgi:hypothetical protein
MAKVLQGQAAELQIPRVWLAANYHFPSTYSCHIPMSSMNSAAVMPAPGPATVRLALIKTGIACFGLEVVRDQLFPILRSAAVRVRPPERVAISQQVLRAYKWSEDKKQRKIVQESIIVREMAHASGPMTVFLQVPEDVEQRLRAMVQAVGYWGQTSSLASYMGVTRTPPVPGECAIRSPCSTRHYRCGPISRAWQRSSVQIDFRGMILFRKTTRGRQRRFASRSTSGRWSSSTVTERRNCWCAPPWSAARSEDLWRCKETRLWGATTLRPPTRGALSPRLRYLL